MAFRPQWLCKTKETDENALLGPVNGTFPLKKYPDGIDRIVLRNVCNKEIENNLSTFKTEISSQSKALRANPKR